MTRYERCRVVYPDLEIHEVAATRLTIRETYTSVGFRRFYICDDDEKFESKVAALIHEVAWLMKEW